MADYQVQIITPLGIDDYDESIFSNFKQSAEKQTANIYDFKPKFDGSLIFVGAAYKKYKTMDATQLRYQPMYIKAWQLCGDDKAQVLDGKLSFLEAEYDDDNCNVKIKVTVDDHYHTFDQEKDTDYNLFDLITKRITAGSSLFPTAIRNGVLLYDAIYQLYRKAFPFGQVRSYFFGWGGLQSTDQDFSRLVLYQKSDVIRRSNVYAPATIMMWSLQKAVETICALLNLQYKIDDVGDLWIDDPQNFASTAVNDFTVGTWGTQTEGLNKWKYNTGDTYKRELFTTLGATNKDFVGLPIVYDNALTAALDKSAEKKIEVDIITDIPYLAGLDPTNEDTDFSGIAIAAVDYATPVAGILTAGTLLDTAPYANNILSWANLHPARFAGWGRLFTFGTMNGTAATFTNIFRSKEQDNLQVTLCCGQTFDPNGSVLTSIGEGVVKSYSFDFRKRILSVNVMFTPEDTTGITIPIAVDDAYFMPQGTILDSAAAGKPALTANDGLFTSVFVENNKNTFSGGLVDIHANGSFKYTPPSPTFYGRDTFQYTIMNANGYTASATATVVVRWPNVYVRERFEDAQGSSGPSCTPNYFENNADWFADSAGTIPLDVTGYGIDLFYGAGGNLGPAGSFPAEGFSQFISFYLDGCGYSGALSPLEASPIGDYTIIP